MKTLTIRGIDEQLEKAIKDQSAEMKESMNQTVVKLLKNAVGLSTKDVFPVYHDLDKLAGGWSKEDEIDFKKQTESFNQIDKEMWD